MRCHCELSSQIVLISRNFQIHLILFQVSSYVWIKTKFVFDFVFVLDFKCSN